ncbi:ribonuclease P protein subunit p40 [Centropristis striata]|uniref:ribonuclease P protein subunit p40 n=1 Tax=Centropristis striata TaxID=184440 RepID=UPI0027DF1BB7|nr:ribonuclease P protein subunit p40 [Centropristis striata]
MTADLERTPRTLLTVDRSSFRDEKNRLSAQVEQLHFNHKVSVLLPECSSAPSHLDAAVNSFSSFYLIRKLNVYELLDKHFLETAVYHGGVCGLSYRMRLDEDNCVALTSDGHLSLSLDKDSFELLGVEGKPSRFNHRTSSRFVVSVDLTDSSMAPGGRGYQRLVTGLTSRLHLQTDFLLSLPPGGGTCVTALLSRYDWSEHRPEVSRRYLPALPRPLLTSDLQACDPHSLLEWLGAVDADVSCENSSSSFLSTLTCPEPKTAASGALIVSVSGLLRPADVLQLVQQLRSHLERSPAASWVALTVHGFVDSPVSWGGAEHGVLRGGENFYSLLLFRDQSYLLHLAAGAQDACPP